MSVELVPFTFEGQQVRTVTIDGEPVLVGKDVCDVLGISKYRDALAQLDDDERVSVSVDTLGGPQLMVAVTEPGLYVLLLISRSPKAKPFRRWVTHEVIPQIRRTGSYLPRQPQPAELSRLDLIEMARAAEMERLALEQRVTELEPAAEAWATLATANGDLSVADAAKLLSRDPAIKIGRDRLFTVLRTLGWIYRQEIDNRWRIYQRAVETGRLSELTSTHYHPRTGELVLDAPQVRVTVKGLQELHRHLGGTERRAIEQGRGAA